MEKTSVLAITKNGVNIGENLKKIFPDWSVFAPSKLTNDSVGITWYSEPTDHQRTTRFCTRSNSRDSAFSNQLCLFGVPRL